MLSKQVFADRLGEKRQDMGVTQEAFAKRIGVTRSTYNLYEAGKRYPPLETFARICEELNIAPEYFLSESGNAARENQLLAEELGLTDEAIAMLRGMFFDKKITCYGLNIMLFVNTVLSHEDFYKCLLEYACIAFSNSTAANLEGEVDELDYIDAAFIVAKKGMRVVSHKEERKLRLLVATERMGLVLQSLTDMTFCQSEVVSNAPQD